MICPDHRIIWRRDPGLKIQYVPDHAALAQCFEVGRRIGQAVNQSVQP
jgi:flavorubredoxin